MVPVLPGEGEHKQPWGGIEDVYGVAITMHYPMGLEFSLSNQMNALF